MEIIRIWAGEELENIIPIGSYTRDRGEWGSTEIDLMVLLDIHTCGTLKDLYENLFAYLESKNLSPQKKNFSIRLIYSNVSFEPFSTRKPAVEKKGNILFNCQTQTCIETDVQKHTELVLKSGRLDEIRAIKIWRNLTDLKLPKL